MNINESSDTEYEVEKILDFKLTKKKKKLFLVKWKGYNEEYNSWEPEENLTNAKQILKKFFSKKIIKKKEKIDEDQNNSSILCLSDDQSKKVIEIKDDEKSDSKKKDYLAKKKRHSMFKKDFKKNHKNKKKSILNKKKLDKNNDFQNETISIQSISEIIPNDLNEKNEINHKKIKNNQLIKKLKLERLNEFPEEQIIINNEGQKFYIFEGKAFIEPRYDDRIKKIISIKKIDNEIMACVQFMISPPDNYNLKWIKIKNLQIYHPKLVFDYYDKRINFNYD